MGATQRDNRAIAALIPLTLVWGYNWVVMKIALSYAGPFDFAALRTVFGVASLFGILLLLRRPLRPPQPARVALLGMFQTTGFLGLVTWALESGGAGKTSVLAFTMPFWVILFARVFLEERIRGLQWIAVLVAFTGLVCIIAPWEHRLDTTSSLLAVGAGASWGASVIVSKKIPIETRWDLLSITTWQMAFGGIPILLIAWLVPQPPIDWSWPFIGAIAFNTLPANALAWLLWLWLLQRLPAGVTSLNSLAIPVVGATAAWLQLGERPEPWEGVGMGLIVTALTLLTVRGLLTARRP